MILPAPSGLDEIIHVFGSLDEPNFEAHHIVMFDLPYPLRYAGKVTYRSRCHKLAVDNFVEAFQRLKSAKLDQYIQNFSGIYARRSIRGAASHPSAHSWGIAIDVEAEKYPLKSLERLPQPVVDIWHEAGFTYGGDFKSRKDPMHFQLCSNY